MYILNTLACCFELVISNATVGPKLLMGVDNKGWISYCSSVAWTLCKKNPEEVAWPREVKSINHRYNLTEDGFRVKFCTSRPEPYENLGQFITRLGPMDRNSKCKQF